jgi:hypothetical protein
MCVNYITCIIFLYTSLVIIQNRAMLYQTNKHIVKLKWSEWDKDLFINQKIYRTDVENIFNSFCDVMYADTNQEYIIFDHEDLKDRAKQIFYSRLNLIERDIPVKITDEDINKIVETLPLNMNIVEYAKNAWLIKNTDFLSNDY